MSTISISYDDLKNASDEAKSVARKFDSYANSLERKVYKKLNNYDGQWTSGISNAFTKIGIKISDLRDQNDKYAKYSEDLRDLRDKCKDVDKSVKSKVSSLTASFKDAYGIRSNVVKDQINYFFTWAGNETAFGRWLGGKKDDIVAKKDYLKQSISEWYNYEGGKEYIWGTVVGALEVACGVLAIIGALATGGLSLVVVAGILGGMITLANGVANIMNENKAYIATQNGDPATGRRRSEINTCQDYLRSSFIFGDSGENYKYDKSHQFLATGIDIVNIACSVVTVVSSAGKLLKNGYKWATGSGAKLKDITMKQVFSKETFGAYKTKLSNRFLGIKEAFKNRKGMAIVDFCIDNHENIYNDFKRNIKSEYFNFFKDNGEFKKFDLKGSAKSIKNMLSIPKDLIKNTLSGNPKLFSLGAEKVLFPGLTAFKVLNDDEPYITTTEDGIVWYDFTDNVSMSEITGIFEKGGKLGSSLSELFKDDSKINIDVFNKLEEPCDINISIPEVYMPRTDMSVLRVA